jgi:hypothetical protein
LQGRPDEVNSPPGCKEDTAIRFDSWNVPPEKLLEEPVHLAGRHLLSFIAGDDLPLSYEIPASDYRRDLRFSGRFSPYLNL